MSWLDFINKIYLVNLEKRTDRLLESAAIFEEYGIPYHVFTAIEKEKGAEGLRDTMLLLFKDALENGYKNILVFEDDVSMVVDKFWFHQTMDEAVKQLPDNYWLFFLGGQPAGGYSHFCSPNILPANKYYATQSVMYSQQGIKEILARGMEYPIDNWMVDKIQNQGNCYAVHPLLCSQRAGHSDIYNNFIDWNPFIVQRHSQKISEMSRKW